MRDVFTRILRDAGTVGQVDETRACVFLKQGRITEAEEAARAAVRSQEKTGRHALLAEALITHGRALARLQRYNAALFAFRRAFDLSVNRRAIYNYVKRGRVQAFKIAGSTIRVCAHCLLQDGDNHTAR